MRSEEPLQISGNFVTLRQGAQNQETDQRRNSDEHERVRDEASGTPNPRWSNEASQPQNDQSEIPYRPSAQR